MSHTTQQHVSTDTIGLSSIRTTASHVHDEEAPANAIEAIPDGGYGWIVVGACHTLLFWVSGYITAWGVLQTAIVKSPQLHTDLRTITFVGSLYMAVMVGFGLGSVSLMRTFGARWTLVAAVLLFGLGLIATSYTLDQLSGLFCIAGVALGLGSSLLYTATNSMPVQWFSSKLGTASGIVKAGGGLGGTVLPIVAQALIDRVGLEWTFRILGCLVLATGIPCALLIKEFGLRRQASRFDWSLLKNLSFMTLASCGAIGVFALWVPPFFIPLFASSIGLSTATGAGLVAGFGAATFVGRLAGGWFCDSIGALNTLTITCLVNSLTMLAIWPVSTSLAPLVIFAIANGCANGSFFTALPASAATLAPGAAAATISLATTFWTPGYLLGPPLAGILIDVMGAAEASSIEPYRAAIFYAAGTGVLALMLAIAARLRLDKKLIKKL